MEPPDQHNSSNLGFDLVRVTEAAALAAGRFMGLGKPDQADEAATKAMRPKLETMSFQGHIVIGEEARLGNESSLSSDQVIGIGNGPEMDVVLDAIDGRRLLAFGQHGAISVAAIAPRGSMWVSPPAVYMEKIVTDREVGAALVQECMDAPAAWTLSLIARRKGKQVKDLVVFVLDRPRHVHLIEEIRSVGARVMLRMDGDISGAIMAATGKGNVDVLMGIGGVEEGIIAACGVKSLGGAMLGRLAPQSKGEYEAVQVAGLNIKAIMRCSDMISSKEVFFAATGITDGSLLDGVRYQGNIAVTNTLLLRCETGSRRYIRAEHSINADQAAAPQE